MILHDSACTRLTKHVAGCFCIDAGMDVPVAEAVPGSKAGWSEWEEYKNHDERS